MLFYFFLKKLAIWNVADTFRCWLSL